MKESIYFLDHLDKPSFMAACYTEKIVVVIKCSLCILHGTYFPSQISNDFSFLYNGLMCKNEPENWVSGKANVKLPFLETK